VTDPRTSLPESVVVPYAAGEPDPMKCISVPQPWAWTILAGFHRVEFRCFSTNYRGDVLVYANAEAREWDRKQFALFGQIAPCWEDLLINRVIGLVELYDCVPGTEGEWGWHLRNPRPVAPFWIRPGRGLFDVPDARVRVIPPTSRSRMRRRLGLVQR
jgi:hypothetical protein